MIKRCYASHKAFPGYFSKNCRLDSHKDKHRVTLFTSLKKKKQKNIENFLKILFNLLILPMAKS